MPPPSTSDGSGTNILDLPAELRLLIYEQLLAISKPDANARLSIKIDILPLMITNHQVRAEMLPQLREALRQWDDELSTQFHALLDPQNLKLLFNDPDEYGRISAKADRCKKRMSRLHSGWLQVDAEIERVNSLLAEQKAWIDACATQ